ncbi:hypothetical protein PM082_000301, partial [Marasmius tenuissimus]
LSIRGLHTSFFLGVFVTFLELNSSSTCLPCAALQEVYPGTRVRFVEHALVGHIVASNHLCTVVAFGHTCFMEPTVQPHPQHDQEAFPVSRENSGTERSDVPVTKMLTAGMGGQFDQKRSLRPHIGRLSGASLSTRETTLSYQVHEQTKLRNRDKETSEVTVWIMHPKSSQGSFPWKVQRFMTRSLGRSECQMDDGNTVIFTCSEGFHDYSEPPNHQQPVWFCDFDLSCERTEGLETGIMGTYGILPPVD